MKKLLPLVLLGCFSLTTANAVVVVDNNITEKDVITAQQNWCSALVDISSTYDKDGFDKAKIKATDIINQAYGYDEGVVLFKPTLTVNPQTFRLTPEGALSYFVGGDPKFPQDEGFALKGWVECKPENAAIFITGNAASTMGKVHLKDKNGAKTTVDKTWQFIKDNDDRIKIMLHHSSLEYSE